ncbi:unnamed protein product [[Actinomadura] parvosata subsp. kistnae]|uniref:Uncharacterized protein n=1 Tax=[Actinomadura] parvosata subsp. kistnae TaxID=1909395 RepID=A0A1V0ABA0_9ACTN|nr:hypothetical protein [Nonomuraea sp. ATCC 55076]AQZ67475.1 hypothetical protein BKM31_43810 [Nonomuraea sp. ATCC 55076]SPL94271.1 unnamed protein product [Actinomadura parvosata subsp. kistnae]
MSLSQIIKVLVTDDEVTVVGKHTPSPEQEGCLVHYYFVLSKDDVALVRGDTDTVLPRSVPPNPAPETTWVVPPLPRPQELKEGMTVLATALGVIETTNPPGFQTLLWSQELPVTAKED